MKMKLINLKKLQLDLKENKRVLMIQLGKQLRTKKTTIFQIRQLVYLIIGNMVIHHFLNMQIIKLILKLNMNIEQLKLKLEINQLMKVDINQNIQLTLMEILILQIKKQVQLQQLKLIQKQKKLLQPILLNLKYKN